MSKANLRFVVYFIYFKFDFRVGPFRFISKRIQFAVGYKPNYFFVGNEFYYFLL